MFDCLEDGSLFDDKRENTVYQRCMYLVKNRFNIEPWRKHHDIAHLDRMYSVLRKHRVIMPQSKVYAFIIAIAFHDFVNDPTQDANEEKSIDHLQLAIDQNWLFNWGDIDYKLVRDLIRSTSKMDTTYKSEDEILFSRIDCDVLINGTVAELIAYENGIFQEYQFVNYADYVPARLKVLDSVALAFKEASDNVDFLKEYVKSRRPKIGLYVGSFAPFHVGHLSIANEAAKIFDKVVIVQGKNPAKSNGDYQIKDKSQLRFFETAEKEGMIADIIAEYEKMYDVVIVRGLRNGLDLAYEFDYTAWLRDFGVNNQVVYIPAEPKLAHISSSSIRGLGKMNPDVAKRFIVD